MEQSGNPFALGQVDHSSASSGTVVAGSNTVSAIGFAPGIQPWHAFPQEMPMYPMQSGFAQQPVYLQQSFPQR